VHEAMQTKLTRDQLSGTLLEMSADWLRSMDRRNQLAIERAADRARSGYLRRSSGSLTTTGVLAVFAAFSAFLAYAGDDAGRNGSLTIAVIVGIAAVVGLVVGTWRAEVDSDRIVFKGLLCPLRAVPLSGLTAVAICTYKWELTVPRLRRQCIELRYKSVTPTRLRWFWRRPPWGDESSEHPDLIQFAAAVRASHARCTTS
jgi:hypothetical protein